MNQIPIRRVFTLYEGRDSAYLYNSTTASARHSLRSGGKDG